MNPMRQMLKPILMAQLMLCGVNLPAQKTEKSIAAIYYNCSHAVDATQTNNPVKFEGLLLIGKETSMFADLGVIQSEARVKAYMEKNGQPVTLGGATYFYGAPTHYYKHVKEGRYTAISLLKGNRYAMDEPSVKQDWTITNETKNIGGYHCQKATTHFRGRSYEAWFANALPYQNGPWKLGGLPGLILEAYDTNKEIVFTFKSLEDTSSTVIELPPNTIATTEKELYKTIEGYQHAPPATGGNMVQQGAMGAPAAKKRVFNNPIEKQK